MNVIVVAHKFLTQPDDDLVLFLNGKNNSGGNAYGNVLHIMHSFSDAPDRRSYFRWYKNGELFKEGASRDFRQSSEPVIYMKEMYFTFIWAWKAGIVWDTYIGMDGLCSLFGIMLRFFRRAKKVIYWAIDFVPEKRFAGALKNKIYNFINIYGYRHADEMWDLSARMAEAREKFLGTKVTDYKSHKVVPYGVWTERIKKYTYEECEKNTLVFMGHLIEKQGVQLVIQSIPEILKVIPDFRFKIIGDGQFKQSLMEQAKEQDVLSHCDFRGKIEDIKELEAEVAKSCIAIAPYINSLDTWSYYADPGKVKTYLACGVPVLLTDIPWNAKEIEKAGCGKIISEESKDLVSKIQELMQPETNRQYRKKAVAYSQSFDYREIFSKINI